MILKTNRLELKKISENDCNRICELFQNEIIKKTYILPDFKSKEEVFQWGRYRICRRNHSYHTKDFI